MDKRSLSILEKAFEAEIDEAVDGGIGVTQTRSKLAEKLVKDGYLEKVSERINGWPPIIIDGYRLTHAGRIAYCMTCSDEEEPTNG